MIEPETYSNRVKGKFKEQDKKDAQGELEADGNRLFLGGGKWRGNLSSLYSA